MFCHLHVHNEFSLLDGYGSAAKYVEKAIRLGFEYLGLTNHGNISGLIQFQKACLKAGIKPVLGCELYLVRDLSEKGKGENRHHITVLIKNQTGFENLCRILSVANLQGFYYKPRADYKLILDHCDGLVFLTGCTKTCLTTADGQRFIQELISLCPGDVYYEVMPHDFEEQKSLNRSLKEEGPLVATNDCHYINTDEDVVQEVLLAIQTKAKWGDKDRWRFETRGLHLRSEEEMKRAFAHQGALSKGEYLTAMRNTIEIAEKCSGFRIEKKPIYLPKPKIKEQENAYLRRVCLDGYERIFGKDLYEDELYFSRFEEEYRLIKKKGFVRYFLIVRELIEWCRKSGIMTGPGRGSVGGSLIAYLSGITNVDPLKYNLLFSRFIDEERIDYPDIDIDFEDIKRPLIRGHLEEFYGKNNIAAVTTFMSMNGRAVIRDVARVFDVPLREVDEFAKSIIEEENSHGAVANALETPEGRAFERKYPDVVKYAIKLEGQIRGTGKHAAALIVSEEDLTLGKRGNLETRNDQEVVNWDKDDAEYMGLMKLDILGLNTLSILNETRRLIKKNRGEEIAFEKIPLDNPQVFEMLSKGKTVGVFQFNTWSTTKLCKEVGVENFGLMSDVIALVRPGPADSGMTAEFIKRKHGGKWKRKHKIYEEITKDTFGIIVYQEQVMEVIVKVAGLPYSMADKIRKIIGKKRDPKEFEPYEKAFIEGCQKTGIFDTVEAKEFWEGLQAHARYSFNKSHSVEYATIAYWTAWCKLYFPGEFFCANLTYGLKDKKEEIVEEAKQMGLQIVLPRVGISDAFNWVLKDNNLYVPFIEVKGVGEKTAEEFANFKPSNGNGFFNLSEEKKTKGKIEKLLDEIGAIDGKPKGDISQFFSFDVNCSSVKYPKLEEFMGREVKDAQLCRLVSLDFESPGLVRGAILEKTFRNPELFYCEACPLKNQCKKPVLPSKGLYNVPIIGEAPGRDEDEKGQGFIGRAGKLLWGELEPDFRRIQFHVTNVVKCFPGEVRTPGKPHIEACRHWLEEEIKMLNAKVCLVFGNTGLLFFREEQAGITKLSGTTEWNERYGLWVCYSIHPSAALHNPQQKTLLREGIRNFKDKLKLLGGIK